MFTAHTEVTSYYRITYSGGAALLYPLVVPRHSQVGADRLSDRLAVRPDPSLVARGLTFSSDLLSTSTSSTSWIDLTDTKPSELSSPPDSDSGFPSLL